MRFRFLIIGTVLFILFSIQPAKAQKVLLLQKPGKTKRFLYHTGDHISIRTGEPKLTFSGEITYIDDSVFTLDKNFTFQIGKISEVVRPRFFLAKSYFKLYGAALLYAGGSMLNHGIHNEKPVFDNTIPWVSGSFIVLGTTTYLLRYHTFRMEKQWRLKVLDFDIFKEKSKSSEAPENR